MDTQSKTMEVQQLIRTWNKENSQWAEDHVRFPYATRRVTGRTWPGEERRQVAKMKWRKSMRGQADMLCKFMLFKKGKFLPGRMV